MAFTKAGARAGLTGGLHAYPADCLSGAVCRRTRRSAAVSRQGAILLSLLQSLSTELALLRRGCSCRYRRGDRHRAVLRGRRRALLLLRVPLLLQAGLLLPGAAALSPAPPPAPLRSGTLVTDGAAVERHGRCSGALRSRRSAHRHCAARAKSRPTDYTGRHRPAHEAGRHRDSHPRPSA